VNPDVAPPVWLLTGPPDDALLEDLATPPLRAANRDRILPATLSATGAEWELSSETRIDADTIVTLAVGGWLRSAADGERLPEPIAEPVHVSPDSGAGTEVTASWPPDGAAAVSPDLTFLALRFDGPLGELVDGSVSLREGDNHEEIDVSAEPCPEVGWSDGVCLRVRPIRPLRRGSEHQLVIDERLLDTTGASVGPWTARFTTSSDAPPEPGPRPLPCALDERVVADDLDSALGCALSDDARIVFRVDFGEPARMTWTLGADRVLIIAPRGAADLTVAGLPAATPFLGVLRVVGTSGLVSEFEVTLATTQALPRISIVEVRANPLGPEPTQEYVEVLNYGSVSIDLDGFTIADREDAGGDLLTGGLAPGERALIVSERFDPEDPADPGVPPGVRLLRIDRSIGAGGLSNAGEPLFLRDGEGRRLSAAPALASSAGGVCLVRAGAPGRPAEDFVAEPCTPGTP